MVYKGSGGNECLEIYLVSCVCNSTMPWLACNKGLIFNKAMFGFSDSYILNRG